MRVATDIGGTFTDLVCVDEHTGELRSTKTSTTPARFEQGVLDALRKADTDLAGISAFVHGTTIVINTLTERSGAAVGLITTRGFRDVLEIGRGNRPDMYNFYYRKPVPFVPRHLRFEVSERVTYQGEEITPLAEDEVRAAVAALRQTGVAAVAICFLHSYANDAHERRCAAIVAQEWPEVLVTFSSAITREWREYERTSTVVLNAYVQPRARAYLSGLREELRAAGLDGSLYVMQSNGGATSFADAERSPIQLIESGPVAGIYGAALLGRQLGIANLIGLDIGGTTAKCSLIDGGEVKVSTDYKIEWTRANAGHPVKIPVVDIVEIGAGGGSIGWFDAAGALHVGPRSAGAVPGPACYGLGGTEPTITDANLIAGRIDPDYFLGGEIRLTSAAAREAIAPIAERLGLGIQEAAVGMIRLTNANMVTALKLISVQRGYDPRDFSLVAFGGGGAMHAAALAEELRIAQVIIPVDPAVFSAWGMLMSDLRRDVIQTHIVRADRVAPEVIDGIWLSLEQELKGFLAAEGFSGADMRVGRRVDMRYVGQEHTVNLPFPAGKVDPAILEAVRTEFNQRHEHLYTYKLEAAVEFVNFHATVTAPVAKPQRPPIAAQGSEAPARRGRRPVHFDHWGVLDTPIYERSALGAGVNLEGPTIVEEPASTTVVLPGQTLRVDEWGNLLITIGVR
ncbi:MAG TPA: hydantoinase/oxoprolinase family protein [Chloroflexota bacterium]